MSHTVTTKTELKDKECLKKACERLKVKYEEVTNYRLYDGTVKSGVAIHLPDWNYPVIIDENNDAFYDNYKGNWGDIKHFNDLKTYYGVEKTKKLARAKGLSAREVVVNNKVQVRISL